MISWLPSQRSAYFLAMVHLARWVWDLEARKIARSNDVYFNEEKMHKRPIPTVEIWRVVFQEDGVVHRDIAPNVRQQG